MDKKDKDELISFISSLKKNDFTDHLIEYINLNGSIKPGVYVKSKNGRIGIVNSVYYDTNITVKWGLSPENSIINLKDISVVEYDEEKLIKPDFGDIIYSFSGVHGTYEFSETHHIQDTDGFNTWELCFVVNTDEGIKYIYESDIVKVVKT